ncbi:314L [Invertebrate iridescent virus Kaz2018]|uniref:314L n=1 Tax=Invertebrate iridescent virus 6 TaxID=176652 RepID=Q91FL0_IIV6|nr:314L [Invertebrate iridescent virus 6]AAK82175.1 314L [Invertebrate iridescent virus 6]QMS79677.1 hypothetical protein IIV6-T1_308 [Invertebrate iridescent virus 6]QNH08724.1 314L [Invertebrate iridescent virus Kaz2018]
MKLVNSVRITMNFKNRLKMFKNKFKRFKLNLKYRLKIELLNQIREARKSVSFF